MAKKTAKRSVGKRKPSPKLTSEQVDIAKLPVEPVPSLGTIWSDRMQLSLRSDQPIGQMRFFCAVGSEYLTEVARIQTTRAHLSSIADLLCHCLDHYPVRPK